MRASLTAVYNGSTATPKKRTPPEETPSGGAALIAGGNDEIAFALKDAGL